MPIGKNAVKRVENNGYSKVQSAAPDMENSNVIANVDEQVMQVMVKPVEEAVEKKPACKKSTAKKSTAKKNKVKNGEEKVELGKDLPYYLL